MQSCETLSIFICIEKIMNETIFLGGKKNQHCKEFFQVCMPRLSHGIAYTWRHGGYLIVGRQKTQCTSLEPPLAFLVQCPQMKCIQIAFMVGVPRLIGFVPPVEQRRCQCPNENITCALRKCEETCNDPIPPPSFPTTFSSTAVFSHPNRTSLMQLFEPYKYGII